MTRNEQGRVKKKNQGAIVYTAYHHQLSMQKVVLQKVQPDSFCHMCIYQV